jgi:hypothetical protein
VQGKLRGWVLGSCIVALVALALGTLASTGAADGLQRAAPVAPQYERLGTAPVTSIRSRIIRGGRALTGARSGPGHGGSYTTATGERVTVFVSDAYPVDDTLNQRWADFFARLVHGPELAKVSVYVAPLSELQGTCHSTEADACYLLSAQQMILPGDVPADSTPVEEIAAHEYGHHIAMNRSNWPWLAIDWGTKRWASHERVCERAAAHTAFPGDEGANYFRNPGEAFAEAYRVLNGRRAPLGSVQLPWIMDGFEPDSTALALLEQDVRTPWVGSTITHWRGRVGRASVRRLTVPTPRDGYAKFVLRAGRGSALLLFHPTTGKLVGGARREIRYGVCGERKLRIGVLLTRAGRYSVGIYRP